MTANESTFRRIEIPQPLEANGVPVDPGAWIPWLDTNPQATLRHLEGGALHAESGRGDGVPSLIHRTDDHFLVVDGDDMWPARFTSLDLASASRKSGTAPRCSSPIIGTYPRRALTGLTSEGELTVPNSDDNYEGRFDGTPGLVWYATVTPTRGDALKVGDWLDSLDHSGARTIRGIRVGSPGHRQVHFGGGCEVYSDGSSDSEVIRDDVMYDVVDPRSQVDPFGDPIKRQPSATRPTDQAGGA